MFSCILILTPLSPLSQSAYNNAACVIDNGTGYTKMGYAGNCEPNYIIPTALDTPPMDTKLVEIPYPHGPFGAKGVGELPMDGIGPAIAAAIEHATGVFVDRQPAMPEYLLPLLEARE